ncbi:hypothetical protein CCS41_13180 [Candidatus Fukatsuia symbiotica]|uniref:Thioester reductase (TE) domain-containing protein n=1 Tax=Candidatus Fukatsuia symbiotica TaxID=1878942 RepID=A0A2U8I7Q7_9GAMM|nr:hypothetical protein CCS41_13180 [Candidatus Fukatsuia symbiotica]
MRVTAPHGQTLRSPPAKPGDYLILFTTQHLGDLALKIDGKAIKQNNVIQQSVEQDQWLANTRPYLSEPSVNFETILLTGATGFLGIYLLSQLQQSLPNSITYCLIRANNEVTAQEKLQANATHYRLNIDFKRIIILLGDLKQENLGLNSSQWQNIVIQIDAIYHCGAQVNHLYHYFSLRHANVSSTLTLLALCQQGRKKQFFYISTLSTALQQGNLIEENCVANAPPKENGYIQSKWIAERLIQQAFAQGLYGTIYRMGNITGCTRYGYSNTENNHGLSVIKGCLQQGIAPLWKYYDVDITPVDKVADLLVQSSINGLHAKQCVNLSYLTSLPWVEILQQIANDASPIEFVSPGEWAKIWVPKIKQGNALYFFKSFYLQTEERPKIIVERNYVKQVNLPLDGMKLLSLYRQYWQKTGFITRNLIEISCARRVAVK